MVEEQNYMRRAIRLAKQGIPWASPNPLVGAVIVKKGRVIGEGCHARCGGMHAERAALEACTEDPAGATVYVTLEPCCHQGRQPPCTQALIESGVARVVVGSRDPNPKVAGRGIAQLRAAGEHGLVLALLLFGLRCIVVLPCYFWLASSGMALAVGPGSGSKARPVDERAGSDAVWRFIFCSLILFAGAAFEHLVLAGVLSAVC